MASDLTPYDVEQIVRRILRSDLGRFAGAEQIQNKNIVPSSIPGQILSVRPTYPGSSDTSADWQDPTALGVLTSSQAEYLLAEKADEGHRHDDLYTSTVIAATIAAALASQFEYAMAEKSDEGHTHAGRYVATAGDTMTGTLMIDNASAAGTTNLILTLASAQKLIFGANSTTSWLNGQGIQMIAAINGNVSLGTNLATLTSAAADPGSTDASASVATTNWVQSLLGRVLDYVVAEKSDEGHNHDQRYITTDAIQARVNAEYASIPNKDQLDYLLAEKADEGHSHPFPGQEIGYAEITANAGEGDSFSMTCNIPAPGNYIIEFWCLAQSATVAGSGSIAIYDGAAATGTQHLLVSNANFNTVLSDPQCGRRKISIAAAGPKTFYANMQQAAGVATMYAAAVFPAFIRLTRA